MYNVSQPYTFNYRFCCVDIRWIYSHLREFLFYIHNHHWPFLYDAATFGGNNAELVQNLDDRGS
jgi:hypothetical protein